MGKSVGQLIIKLWAQQLSLLCLLVVIHWWFSPIAAYSALIGGLIYWFPNAYFTLYAFRFQGAEVVAMALRSIYRGQVGKFLLTGVGFAIAFRLVQDINPIALFVVFLIMTFSQTILVSRWDRS